MEASPPQAAQASPPSKRRRRRLSLVARLTALWFFAVGIAAIFLGAHEVVFAVSWTYRLAGVLIAAVGLGLVASSVGFWRRRSWSYSYAAVAAAGCGVLSVLLLVAQLINYPTTPRIAVWVVAAVPTLVLALVVSREGSVSFEALARRRVRVASSVLSVGAFLSVAQFWNSAVRVPPASAPSLVVTESLHQLKTADNGLARVEGDITFRNSSSTKIWVLGGLYNLIGGTVEPSELRPSDFKAGLAKGYIGTSPGYYAATRHVDKQFVRVIESGRLLGDLVYFVPGDVYTIHLSFFAPRKSYDFLRLETTVTVAKDTLSLDDRTDPTPHRIKVGGVRRIAMERPIRSTSWLERLLRGSSVVHEDVLMDESNGYIFPSFYVYIDRAGRPSSDGTSAYSQRMGHLYGLGQSDGEYELALE